MAKSDRIVAQYIPPTPHSMDTLQALGRLSSRELLILLGKYKDRLALLIRRAGLSGWLAITLAGFLARLLGRYSRALNPFPALFSLLYFESVHKPSDASYAWIQEHWIQHPRFEKQRAFRTETGVREELAWPSKLVVAGTPAAKEARGRLQPSFRALDNGKTFYEIVQGTLFRYARTSMTVKGSGGKSYIDTITVRCFTRDRSKLLLLLDQLKDEHERRRPPVVSMRTFNSRLTGYWETLPVRQKRRWSDIILPEESKTELKIAVADFLESQHWYGDRGLAWKMGIMLHGPPGCGKTSTILGIASEFQLPVYILPLSSDSMRDSLAASGIRKIPPRAIILLEDIDAWSQQRARKLCQNGDDAGNEGGEGGIRTERGPASGPGAPAERSLSLSCLLNIIDGVEAMDGKIIICTSNAALDTLDPALIRPGRMDFFMQFNKASKAVAEQLFVSFYRPPVTVGSTGSAIRKLASLTEGDDEKAADEVAGTILSDQAQRWATHIEDEEFSLAELQGMLLGYKKSPQIAVEKMEEWVHKLRRAKSRGAAKKGTASSKAVRQEKVGLDPVNNTDASTGSLSSGEPLQKQDPPVVAGV